MTKAKTEITVTRGMVALNGDQIKTKLGKDTEIIIVKDLRGHGFYLDILVRWTGEHTDSKDKRTRTTHDNYLWVNHSWLGEWYD